MAGDDSSTAKCGLTGHAPVSLPSSPAAFFALSRKRPSHVSLPTSPTAPSADRAGNCSPDSLPAQSRDRLHWPSNPSEKGIRAGNNAYPITVTAPPTRRTAQPPPSNDRECPSISTLATPARRQVQCSGARQSLPDSCGVHAPTLYEFSLVEDLATGSSIYKHKYHEKAAAMEVRMSEFARRLVASLAGPLMLSVPVVSDTLAELLEATTHADGDHRSQVCRRVEAGFSIVLVVVCVCSYCVSGASPFAHDGYAMAFLYVAMTTLHAAIRSPDKVGQYVTTKHDFQPDAGSKAAPVTQSRPASPSCEGQNGDWESSGDGDVGVGQGLDESTSLRQESDASQSGLSASCGRDRAEQHSEAASEATPMIKTNAAVAMSARRNGTGEDWDSEGAPPRLAQRAVSFEGLHPGSVAKGALGEEGGGEVAGSTGLAARQSKAPVKADTGRGGGAGGTEGIEFIELQERWRMMQRKSVLAYTSARQAVYTSLDQLCQEVFAARGMDWKAARKRAATRTAFGAALYALTAPLHRVVEAELTKLATVHVSCPGGWRLSDLFVLGMEGAGSKSGSAVASSGVVAGSGGAWGGGSGGLVVAALLGKTWMEGLVSAGSLVANFLLAWVMLLSVARAVEAYHKMLRRSRSLFGSVCVRLTFLCAMLDLRSARRAGLPHLPIVNVTQAQAWLLLRQCVKTLNSGTVSSRTVDYVVTAAFVTVSVIFLHFVVSPQGARGAGQLAVSVADCQAGVVAMLMGLHVIEIVHMGSVINAILHDQVVLMNEQLKLCLRAHAEPAYKEACDRTIKFLDITRFAQKECNSPLHVLGLPFNDTLFRVTIGVMISAAGSVLSRALGFNVGILNTIWRF